VVHLAAVGSLLTKERNRQLALNHAGAWPQSIAGRLSRQLLERENRSASSHDIKGGLAPVDGAPGGTDVLQLLRVATHEWMATEVATPPDVAIHLRLGDMFLKSKAIMRTSHAPPLSLWPPLARKLSQRGWSCVTFLVGVHNHQSSSAGILNKSISYLHTVYGIFRSFDLHIGLQTSSDPDKDFATMVAAPIFVCGSGGFSVAAAALRTRLGRNFTALGGPDGHLGVIWTAPTAAEAERWSMAKLHDPIRAICTSWLYPPTAVGHR